MHKVVKKITSAKTLIALAILVLLTAGLLLYSSGARNNSVGQQKEGRSESGQMDITPEGNEAKSTDVDATPNTTTDTDPVNNNTKIIYFQNDAPKPASNTKKTYIVAVWGDSGQEEVNVVQANIQYDAAKVRPLSVTPTETFPNSAQADDETGVVKISRFTNPGTAVKGRHHIADITFEDFDGTIEQNLTLSDGSGMFTTSGAVIDGISVVY